MTWRATAFQVGGWIAPILLGSCSLHLAAIKKKKYSCSGSAPVDKTHNRLWGDKWKHYFLSVAQKKNAVFQTSQKFTQHKLFYWERKAQSFQLFMSTMMVVALRSKRLISSPGWGRSGGVGGGALIFALLYFYLRTKWRCLTDRLASLDVKLNLKMQFKIVDMAVVVSLSRNERLCRLWGGQPNL